MGDIGRHLGLSLAKVGVFLVTAFVVLVHFLPCAQYDYGAFPIAVDTRTAVWFFAELHLMFAAFVLGVPIFALIVECVGVATGDQRYDRLAKEFTRLLAPAFTQRSAAAWKILEWDAEAVKRLERAPGVTVSVLDAKYGSW